MRKIINLLLTISILLTSVSLTVSASPYNADYANRAGLLEYLGIIEEYENENPDREVSRGEFVLMLGRLMKLDGSVVYKERYYMDISEEDELWSITAQLLERRILTMSESKLFRPDDTILIGEASCAIMKLYGLGDIEYNYYQKFARDFSILDGINSGKLRYRDVVAILYNTLVGKPFDFAVPDMKQGNRTYMEIYYDMFFVEGVVNSVNGTSITSISGNRLNTIEIGDTVMNCHIHNPYQYLGSTVGAFYIDDDNPEVCYIYVRANKTETLELSRKNDPKFDLSKFVLSYYNESNQLRRITLPQNVNVILNGENVSDNIEGAFNSFANGRIVLISSSGNREYNTVVIENYYNISVLSVNLDEQTVYGKNGKSIDATDNRDRPVYIENTEGEEIKLDAIEKGNIASVFESKDYLRIIISAKKISGRLDSLHGNSRDRYITVGGVDYEPAEGADLAFNTGQMVILYIDAFGYVADFEQTRQDGMQYGWIIGHYKSDKDDRNEVLLKIFGEDNQITRYTLAERTTIDGSSCGTAEAQLHALELGKSEINEQMVLFKVNDAGVIKEIDTVEPNINGGGLFIDAQDNALTYGSSFVGPNIAVDSSTIVFIVPTAESEKDDEMAYKVTNKDAFKTWSNNNVVSYRSVNAKEPAKAEVVVLYKNMLTDSNADDGIFILTDVSRIWDKENETTRDTLEVMEGNTVKEFYSAEKYSADNDPNIVKGNVLRLNLNSRNEIISTTLLYGTKKDGTEVKAMKNDTANWGTDSPSTVSWGYVTACGNDLAELALTPDGDAFMKFPITTSAICVYEDGVARAGNQGDIAEATIENSVVFVNMFRGSLISIAIIK